MAEPRPSRRQPGWREVVLVAITAVVVVLGAAALTNVLPEGIRNALFYSPVAIFFLIAATGWHLWRVSRRRPDA